MIKILPIFLIAFLNASDQATTSTLPGYYSEKGYKKLSFKLVGPYGEVPEAKLNLEVPYKLGVFVETFHLSVLTLEDDFQKTNFDLGATCDEGIKTAVLKRYKKDLILGLLLARQGSVKALPLFQEVANLRDAIGCYCLGLAEYAWAVAAGEVDVDGFILDKKWANFFKFFDVMPPTRGSLIESLRDAAVSQYPDASVKLYPFIKLTDKENAALLEKYPKWIATAALQTAHRGGHPGAEELLESKKVQHLIAHNFYKQAERWWIEVRRICQSTKEMDVKRIPGLIKTAQDYLKEAITLGHAQAKILLAEVQLEPKPLPKLQNVGRVPPPLNFSFDKGADQKIDLYETPRTPKGPRHVLKKLSSLTSFGRKRSSSTSDVFSLRKQGSTSSLRSRSCSKS